MQRREIVGSENFGDVSRTVKPSLPEELIAQRTLLDHVECMLM